MCSPLSYALMSRSHSSCSRSGGPNFASDSWTTGKTETYTGDSNTTLTRWISAPSEYVV